MPDIEQLEEEGLGAFFHGSEWIGEVDNDEADEVLEIDRALTELIASHAVSREEFELVASIAQYGLGDDSGLSAEWEERLSELVDDIPPLPGLDLGVAGLVYVLSAAAFSQSRAVGGTFIHTTGPSIW